MLQKSLEVIHSQREIRKQAINLLSLMNRLRMWGVGVWLVLGAAAANLSGQIAYGYREVLPFLAGYFIMSVLIYLVAKRSRSWMIRSRYLPTVFDIWMMWLVQSRPIDLVIQKKDFVDIAFTMSNLQAGFLIIMVFSMLSLTPIVTIGCLLIGGPLLLFSMSQLGLTYVGHLFAILLSLAVVTLGASGILQQVLKLSGEVIQAMRIRDRLSRYFSPRVAQEISQSTETKMDGEVTEITVLFIDIRTFTSISEGLPPKKVIELLNLFYEMLIDKIFEFGGTVDKFTGDGALAYFGFLDKKQNHAQVAIECSLAILSEMKPFHELLRQKGLPEISVGIGINSGPAVVGNVGGKQRLEFTAIGDAVNTASRIQELTGLHQ